MDIVCLLNGRYISTLMGIEEQAFYELTLPYKQPSLKVDGKFTKVLFQTIEIHPGAGLTYKIAVGVVSAFEFVRLDILPMTITPQHAVSLAALVKWFRLMIGTGNLPEVEGRSDALTTEYCDELLEDLEQ